MKTRVGILLLAVLMVLSACGPSKEKMQEDITLLEKELFGPESFIPDKNKAEKLMDLYEKYAKEFPQDTTSGLLLYKGGKLAMSINDNERAVALFEKVTSGFPDISVSPEAMFLIAFIYDNNLKNLTKARTAYKEFITLYPSHELTDDARLSLDNLGKTPEQIVKEFEEKLKAEKDSLQAVNQ